MNPTHFSEMIALRHTLHACAELSMHETRTIQILTGFLRGWEAMSS